MVLVGGPAMVEAVRTTQSTFGIWVIVAVAMISLAAWLVGVYIADSYQTRLSRQRRRMGAKGPGLTGAGARRRQRRRGGVVNTGPAAGAGAAGAGARAGDDVGGGAGNRRAARGRHARPGEYYAAADYYATADYKAAEKPPAGHPETRPRGVGEPRRSSQADAPTRPDLPGPGGADRRHAMPTQRSGDSDAQAMPRRAVTSERPAMPDSAQRRLRPGGANLRGP